LTNPVTLIRKKRDGGSLTPGEIGELIRGYVQGEIPEYQMSAFLMATYFRGMNDEETQAITEMMLRSGEVIDLSFLPGLKVDKHSTGGVGDKVSLILTPMVASCGVPVPMISGRGLGHTGGTLDKLESIPGFNTQLTIDEYRRVLKDVGAVMVGQTKEIVPADRKMYALRDVTATVESIPLIAASIMSKKLAEGIDALVLDVKTGEGAFMQQEDRAVELARALVDIGMRNGKRTLAFITSMDQPLGYSVGNWLEVVESIECLRGKSIKDLMEVTMVLGGAMVWLGGKSTTLEEGMRQCQSAIWSGAAYEKFLQMVSRQGGDTTLIHHPSGYPPAAYILTVRSRAAGFIGRVATRQIGMLAIELGAGRKRIDDVLDRKAGIVLKKKLGDRVERDEALAILHTDNGQAGELVSRALVECFTIAPTAPERQAGVRLVVDERGVRPWQAVLLH
jgi:pyrimidine-nucleoside phosphorylase